MEEKELGRFAAWFKRKHIPLKSEWLKICIEYLEQNLGKKLPLSEETLNLVIQQFLHSNLSESLNPVLKIPTNAVKVIIVKRMIFEVPFITFLNPQMLVVQMTSCTNVSTSLYEQLSECTRHNEDLSWFHGGSKMIPDESNREKEEDTTFNNQVDDNNNKKRTIYKKRGMLKLELNDGVNSVKAIEIEEVFEEEHLVPGVKILLTGRVKCRRGTLFLEKSNCSLIGGRIEALKFDKVKQLSDALKLDLDAEKKRRQESLVKASASVKNRKKNVSLNQSSISPFLIKTDRKTGKVNNPSTTLPLQIEEPPSSRCLQENWEDFSIEKVQKSPASEESMIQSFNNVDCEIINSPITKQALKLPSTKNQLSALPINRKDETSTIGLERTRKTEKKTDKTEEWTFNPVSVLENVGSPKKPKIIESKPKFKQLPQHLLRADSSTKDLVIKRPTLGSPSMAAEKRKDISEWIWDERNGSEEEEALAKRKKDDSVVEIPQCFVKPMILKVERQGSDEGFAVQKPKMSTFNRTIHGPRKRIEDYRVNQKSREPEKIPTDKEKCIVSNDIEMTQVEAEAETDIRQLDQEIPEEIDYIEHDEEDAEDYVEIDEIVPCTPHPLSQHQHIINEEREFLNLEHDPDDSIMECTIEQEGIMECERWGLRKKNQASDIMANTHAPSLQVYNPSVEDSVKEINKGDYSNECTSQVYAGSTQKMPIQNQNWNFGYRMTSPQNVKTERLENSEEQRVVSMRQIPLNNRDSIEEIKNKQSENVQIYKTPFAKRFTILFLSNLNRNLKSNSFS
ncbi:hypothetical protein CAEBREN_28381 [Caenorhabditis brenneri]|uniref:Uncharacterized protein n=1 Tax=Caenorhabditis brenneri TaxID=135651 RepID=G0MNM1_CAEBE|nr:hypothetical protein CAEBREN_28381 [Caenorhabditis brenneri]